MKIGAGTPQVKQGPALVDKWVATWAQAAGKRAVIGGRSVSIRWETGWQPVANPALGPSIAGLLAVGKGSTGQEERHGRQLSCGCAGVPRIVSDAARAAGAAACTWLGGNGRPWATAGKDDPPEIIRLIRLASAGLLRTVLRHHPPSLATTTDADDLLDGTGVSADGPPISDSRASCRLTAGSDVL
jgi:hypothetical protein